MEHIVSVKTTWFGLYSEKVATENMHHECDSISIKL